MTRRAVIDAAHELFVANGYAATTIEQIADAADVSRPTVYSVGTKAELLELVRDVAIAGADPQLRRLWQDAEQQRHDGATIVIDDVLDKGDLKPGLDRRRAIDVLWLLMAPDHLRRLRDRGWDESDYERWLADTLVAQLLG